MNITDTVIERALRATIRAAGRSAVVDLLPDSGRPDLLAVLRVTGVRPATPEESHLQMDDVAFQHELRAWTEPDAGGRGRAEDGVPRSAGAGQPQTVLRIGYGHPTATTPRRPVDAVTTMCTEVPS